MQVQGCAGRHRGALSARVGGRDKENPAGAGVKDLSCKPIAPMGALIVILGGPHSSSYSRDTCPSATGLLRILSCNPHADFLR